MKLILIELNEINFDVINYYLNKEENLPGFQQMISKGMIVTESELKYKNLEPWIQWPSVHTGLNYNEHNVFRLGDFVNSSHEQFFEKIEKAGFCVGAISPMNATNKLQNPAYFIPDPWTKTPSDGSFFSKKITASIVQAVNENSQSKLTFSTMFYLALSFIALVRPSRYMHLIRYALRALGKPWRKALFLDIFLYEIHKTLLKRKNPDFSTLFLNAGAHIQHHYFFNSPFVELPNLQNPSWYIKNNEDPFLEMLKVYDEMILDLLSLPNTEILVATGLSQKPYEELQFYYRLKDHKSFLDDIGIRYVDVVPRMTRDFLISFSTKEDALIAEKQLSGLLVDNKTKLFGEIDNRGKDIFVVLTYPLEIFKDTVVFNGKINILLSDIVTFVAIKNGEHQSKGFAYFSDGLLKYAPTQGSHVSNIHNTVLKFFSIKN